jgi:hypothetical protein
MAKITGPLKGLESGFGRKVLVKSLQAVVDPLKLIYCLTSKSHTESMAR